MDATPFKRDILGELAAACGRRGVKLGFYYSHWQDWGGNGGDFCEAHMVNEEYVHPTQEEFECYWQHNLIGSKQCSALWTGIIYFRIYRYFGIISPLM